MTGSNLWWATNGLSQDYKNAAGVINPASNLVQEINCLVRAPDYVYATSQGGSPSGNHTNLGDSLDAARAMLAATGRPTVDDVIIFMTDGQANQPSSMLPCKYFNDKATIAKAANQEIFTIGYGIDTTKCSDSSGFFVNKTGTTNLAMAASPTTDDDFPGGCGLNENKDGDHYFCAPATADLEPVFRLVAEAAIGGAHLVD